MKVVQLNATCGVGSTGKICVGISRCLSDNGIENYILYSLSGNGFPSGIRYADRKDAKLQAVKAHLLGNYGFNSVHTTKKLISELDRIKPDIVHLHNIHSHDCNLELLFDYLGKNHIKLVWTFHDCWAFTAYCPHFTVAKCNKWKTLCRQCPQYREYSLIFDRSVSLFRRKSELFRDLNMTIVTPSDWLANTVKESFLKNYPVEVINNGIDLSAYRPMQSDFREKNGISSEKFVVLGVAFDWGIKKGLDVFAQLAKVLDPKIYQPVLVGTDSKTDSFLPENVISIHRTENQTELAKIYAAADVFINPTREDNFPTVNIEALACGTPVITFETGGSPEIIDETCGATVKVDDIAGLKEQIIRCCSDKPYSPKACRERAEMFDSQRKFQEYVALYRRLYDETARG